MADLRQIYRDLVRFETDLWAAVDRRLRNDHGLQLSWFEIMALLADRTGLRVQDIATEFVISVGGTSKVVDRIEAAGFCARTPNPHDRRSTLLVLTSLGRQKLDDATPAFDDELARRLHGTLADEDLQRLGTMLRSLRAASPDGPPAPSAP